MSQESAAASGRCRPRGWMILPRHGVHRRADAAHDDPLGPHGPWPRRSGQCQIPVGRVVCRKLPSYGRRRCVVFDVLGYQGGSRARPPMPGAAFSLPSLAYHPPDGYTTRSRVSRAHRRCGSGSGAISVITSAASHAALDTSAGSRVKLPPWSGLTARKARSSKVRIRWAR